MARRPKVFCWSDGLRTFTVATTSRAKALQAWGVERDLFKNGGAREITEGGDYQAAVDQPGEVLERRLEVDAGPAPKGQTKPKPSARASVRAAPPGPTKADRARVAQLEKAIASLEARQGREAEAAEARLTRAERELDEAREAERGLRHAHRKAREDLQSTLDEARATTGLGRG